MVIHGKVLVGLMGCDNYSATNCYISAFDADTGQRDWKFLTAALKGSRRAATPGTACPICCGRRGYLDRRHLRSGAQHHLLGRGPDQALDARQPQDRQWATLYSSLDPGPESRHRQAQVVFPARSGRIARPGRGVRAGADRHGGQKERDHVGKPGILWKLDRVTGKFLGHKRSSCRTSIDRIDPVTGEPYRPDILNQKTGNGGHAPARKAAMTGRRRAITSPPIC